MVEKDKKNSLKCLSKNFLLMELNFTSFSSTYFYLCWRSTTQSQVKRSLFLIMHILMDKHLVSANGLINEKICQFNLMHERFLRDHLHKKMTLNKTFAWFCISLVACIENDLSLHDIDINQMFLDLKSLALSVMINVSFIYFWWFETI